MRSGVPAIPYIHITDMHSHLVRLHFSYLSHDAPSRPYTKKTPPKLMKNPFQQKKKSFDFKRIKPLPERKGLDESKLKTQ